MMESRVMKKRQEGFTLIEIIIVVVILSVAAFLTVPLVSNAADIQVRAAANRIAADLDYTKGLAITQQKRYAIVFNKTDESYEIREDPFGINDVIDHPVNPGSFVVDFTGSDLDRVDLVDADFDSGASVSNVITFDYLGSPYSGTSGTALVNGLITLQDNQSGNFTLYVKIEPVTGYVTIDDMP